MAGLIVRRGITGAALCAAAGLLAGCMGSGVTYGTGVPTEVQTIQDLSGIVSLGTNNQREAIDYEPRAPLVIPPDTALPPPSDGQVAALANWPTDPEEVARLQRERSDAIARANEGQSANLQDPGLNIPTSGAGQQTAMTEEEASRQMELMRASKGGSVDVNGNPVRQYLTEPPAAYRVPDPNAPMEIDPAQRPGPRKPLFPNLGKLWPF